jgi:DNA-binding SARP family transcriptional activator
MLSVQLLGPFLLRRGHEAPVPLESGRAESLLAFLLLHRDGAQPRQHVAFLLWPDSTETQALTNLRHVLHTLRRTFPELDRHLEVTARTIRWRDDQPYRLDVGAFEDALAGGCGRTLSRPTPATCSRAARTSGCRRNGHGCAGAIWTRWTGWWQRARSAAT